MTTKSSSLERKDRPEYLRKKALFDQMITAYGRKPVLEILENPQVEIFRLHLANTNQSGGIVDNIQYLAEQRGVEIFRHSRSELSRISRNSRQDQGVACDIFCPGYDRFDQQESSILAGQRKVLIALDGIKNPQNLGMIIRSVTASRCHGLLIPQRGTPDLSPLVIKASAGTIFKSTIIRCENLLEALKHLKANGFALCMLSSHDAMPISELSLPQSIVYVLGSETNGVSDEIAAICDYRVGIPMENGVESLNVAVTAALVAFHAT
jgi:23S rRNA (guanosine2251-2'-O)-methyltransferase